MTSIPPPTELVPRPVRDGFYAFRNEIRHAETDRELVLYFERYIAALGELRTLMSMIEQEFARKMREFRETEAHRL